MGVRRYDHTYIRKALEEDPELAHDLGPLVASYNKIHEEAPITQKALRGIVYSKHEEWFGVPAPEGKRGRPPIHDAERVLQIRKDNPQASTKRLTRLYNEGSAVSIPRNSLAIILRRKDGGSRR
jgi:hypothetical protein